MKAEPVAQNETYDTALFSSNTLDLIRYAEKDILQNSASGIFKDGLIIVDMEGHILSWNTEASSIFGFGKKDAAGQNFYRLLSVKMTVELPDLLCHLQTKEYWIGETGFKKKDGTRVVALCRWELACKPEQRKSWLVLSIAMTTAQTSLLETLSDVNRSRQRFHFQFEKYPDGVFSFNMEQCLSAVNPALCKLTGHTANELMKMSFGSFVLRDEFQELRKQLHAATQGTPQSSEISCIRKDGTSFDVHLTLLPDIVGHRIVGGLGIMRDISCRGENMKHIQYLATHDSLTGLPNRNMLDDRIEHAIDQARRMNTKLGILFLDLNRFKLINDTLGHDKGDILLCAVAERLRNTVRAADTVSRLGGDEFVILLENLHDEVELASVAAAVLYDVCQPLQLESHVLSVSTSIGGSIFPLHGEDKATLLKRADLAMYEAKNFGAGHFQLYSPDMDNKAAGRLVMESGLREALKKQELVLHYQPRLDLLSNSIVGVEALVRWEHPQKGMIHPTRFISMAEEIGLIDLLGEWVLTAACHQLKQWQNEGMYPVKMSVNLSALQLRSGELCRTVERILHETDVQPEFLEFEITESSLMQNLEDSVDTLRNIRNLGITLSIDDFGTGYSSLSYLKQLPIDTIKIDKSFVRDIPANSDDSAIVTATIAMARNLNLKVVAEGVTSFEQIDFLRTRHCDEIQGYLLCQPLSCHEMKSFFKTCTLRGIKPSWSS